MTVATSPGERLIADLVGGDFPHDIGEATLFVNGHRPQWQRLSSGEKAIVRIACALDRTRVHINLRDELALLDRHRTQRVLEAIAETVGLKVELA